MLSSLLVCSASTVCERLVVVVVVVVVVANVVVVVLSRSRPGIPFDRDAPFGPAVRSQGATQSPWLICR